MDLTVMAAAKAERHSAKYNSLFSSIKIFR
jgi:hypothetical protein